MESNAFEIGVVSSTDCSCASLMVMHGQRRLLFDCGEGLQRVSSECKVRLTRMGHVFMTRLHAETLGGLGGMLLTLSDLETSRDGKTAFKISMFGPPALAEYVHAMRFVYRRPESEIEVNQLHGWVEDVTTVDGLKVSALTLHRRDASMNKQEDPKSDEELNDDDRLSPPSAKRAKLEPQEFRVPRNFGKLVVKDVNGTPKSTAQECESVCYWLRAPARRGKFLPKKAKELGVKPGPDFGRLSKGEAVTATDGKLIQPEDCMEVGEPAQSVLVLSCQTLDSIPSLVESEDFKQAHKDVGLLFVIHLSPTRVLEDDRYISWCKDLHGEHVILNKDVCPNRLVFQSSAAIQHDLASKLDASLFRQDLSGATATAAPELDQVLPKFTAGTSATKSTAGDLMQQLVVLPKTQRGIKPSSLCSVKGEQGKKEVRAESPVDRAIEQGEYEITFLGTGAAIPSKYRNVSSILCRFDQGAVMLDAGEGTFTQLVRRFGMTGAQQLVRKELKVVWISHMHADHHLGLLRILHERAQEASSSSDPLWIVGPDVLGEFLRDVSRADRGVQQGLYRFMAIERSATNTSFTSASPAGVGAVLDQIGLEKMIHIPVIHCFNSYGLCMVLKSGRKLVYSGDTRPCDLLVEHGLEADILIHEATFEKEKMDEAIAKKHSTVAEAVQVGVSMKAKFTVLTHFSQRYPKLPPDAEEETGTHVIIASDLMTLQSNALMSAVGIAHKVEQILDERE